MPLGRQPKRRPSGSVTATGHGLAVRDPWERRGGRGRLIRPAFESDPKNETSLGDAGLRRSKR
ncbi:hypothetical protein LTR28_010173, partial [Elasticomyces elasticus]